jgi:erythronate-4-phosphate dehydrogenase
LADADFIGELCGPSILVNTSRGAVVDNDALKSALSAGHLGGASLDVWENEPDIDADLLDLLDFATPHIAGYSIEGKANGTMASVRALARFFGLPLDDWTPDIPPPENPAIRIPNKGMEPLEAARHAVNAAYDIRRDDDALRRAPEKFEELRSAYDFRREPTAYEVELETPDHETVALLGKIGFRTASP